MCPSASLAIFERLFMGYVSVMDLVFALLQIRHHIYYKLPQNAKNKQKSMNNTNTSWEQKLLMENAILMEFERTEKSLKYFLFSNLFFFIFLLLFEFS